VHFINLLTAVHINSIAILHHYDKNVMHCNFMSSNILYWPENKPQIHPDSVEPG
jgi:hypothetical protein